MQPFARLRIPLTNDSELDRQHLATAESWTNLPVVSPPDAAGEMLVRCDRS